MLIFSIRIHLYDYSKTCVVQKYCVAKKLYTYRKLTININFTILLKDLIELGNLLRPTRSLYCDQQLPMKYALNFK